MKYLNSLTFSFGIALALAGCGGGGSSSSLSTSTFVDSPVHGLYYVTSSGVTGTTDANGTFEFKDGDTVTFKIGGAGGLDIGSMTPEPSTPIFVNDMPAGQQVAQILQSLHTGGDGTRTTKIDLTKIVTIPAAVKANLKNVIDTRMDLTLAATNVLGTAIRDIWTDPGNNATLATVAQPAPRTAVQVKSHLSASVANLPLRFPKVDGGSFVTVEDGTNWFTLSNFSGGRFYSSSEKRGLYDGTYELSGPTLKLKYEKEVAYDGSWEQSYDCQLTMTVLTQSATQVNSKFVGTGGVCAGNIATQSSWVVDNGFSMKDLKGKRLRAAQPAGETPDSSSCLPMTVEIAADGGSATLRSQANNNNCPASFTVTLTSPFSSHPYVVLGERIIVPGAPGRNDEAFVYVKLASFADRYAMLNHSRTANTGRSTWQQTSGRFFTFTECDRVAGGPDACLDP